MRLTKMLALLYPTCNLPVTLHDLVILFRLLLVSCVVNLKHNLNVQSLVLLHVALLDREGERETEYLQK